MKTKTRNLIGVAALLFAGSAMADAIISPGVNPDPALCDFDGADATCWVRSTGSPGQPSLEDLAALVGLDDEGLEILYKDETNGKNPGEESGTFAGNYTTVFNSIFEEQASGATISWDGGDFITCPLCYLWVKDGNHSPNLYVFDIDWWDGQESLVLTRFWPDDGAISNIGIFGRGGDTTTTKVPEPGTLGLLSLGLIGLGLARRRKTNA